MRSGTKDAPIILLPPPLIFFVLLGVGFLLDYLFPLRYFRLPWAPRIIASGILFVISGYLALGSMIVLLRNKTPFDPAKPTTKIVHQWYIPEDLLLSYFTHF